MKANRDQSMVVYNFLKIWHSCIIQIRLWYVTCKMPWRIHNFVHECWLLNHKYSLQSLFFYSISNFNMISRKMLRCYSHGFRCIVHVFIMILLHCIFWICLLWFQIYYRNKECIVWGWSELYIILWALHWWLPLWCLVVTEVSDFLGC